MQPTIKLLGIPTDINSSFMRGSAAAPDFIRQMDSDGSANKYSENGIRIDKDHSYIDLGNMFFKASDNAETVHNKIVCRIKKELNNKCKIISLGGDHAITYPIIEGYVSCYPKLNILHFDAHGDIYHSFQNNPYSHASPFARIMENNLAESLTQVGIRALDNHQRQQIIKFNVKTFEMKDFNTQTIIKYINQISDPLYISIDMDALDPSCAPGVSHHEPGGLLTRELLTIVQNCEKEIIGADIVELNPERDVNNMTAMVAYKLLKELLVKMQ